MGIEVTWGHTRQMCHVHGLESVYPRVTCRIHPFVKFVVVRLGTTLKTESMRSFWISGSERETHVESRKFVESTSLKQSYVYKALYPFSNSKIAAKKKHDKRILREADINPIPFYSIQCSPSRKPISKMVPETLCTQNQKKRVNTVNICSKFLSFYYVNCKFL